MVLPDVSMPAAHPLPVDVTVVIPTRNEAGNVREVVRRVDEAFGSTVVELIFVDDSTDATPDAVRTEAAHSTRDIRVLHREENERQDGLSGAVVMGMAEARGRWLIVMDADLQHPPELAPSLITVGDQMDVDLVVATRYDGTGAATGLDGRNRQIVSSAATQVARVLFPRRLRGVTDPMSGFFAVRRDRIDLAQLRPHGFKILLELLVRTPGLRVHEIGFTFGVRSSGTSKASMREGLRYVKHVSRLRFGRHAHGPQRAAMPGRMMRFAAVGATGIAVNAIAMWMLVGLGHITYLVGAGLATQASTTWNWAFTELYVFPGDKPGRWQRRYLSFSAVNNALLLARLPILALLVSEFGVHYLVANLMTLAAVFLGRFVVSDRVIYGFGGGIS
jgi:putative flippase GtrA